MGTNRLVAVPVTCTGILSGKTVISAAAGGNHSLALCSDGTLAAWGGNSRGELGNNTTNNSPIPVGVNTGIGSALYGKRVVAIGAGYGHSLALCSDGTVSAWGMNNYGQLGNGTTNDCLVPVPVNREQGISALYGKTVVTVAAGSFHNLALCSDGTLVAWGVNYYGSLGDNTTNLSEPYGKPLPVWVSTASGISALFGKSVTAIAAGRDSSMALCSDGSVRTWGWNDSGQLGDGSNRSRKAPVAVNTNSALAGKLVVAISAGYRHSLALCSDGTVVAWGEDWNGELGDGTNIDGLFPVAVSVGPNSALAGKTAVAVVAGSDYSIASCSDGTVASWGYNFYGQLGDNTTTDRSTPVLVNTASLAPGQRLSLVAGGSYAFHSLGLVAAPSASEIILGVGKRLSDGTFQFAFTNTPGAFFGVLSATNLSLPLANWTPLDDPAEISSGRFQVTDRLGANNSQRFYRVRSP